MNFPLKFKDLCRICLEKTECENAIDLLFDKKESQKIIEKVYQCFQITITIDNFLPKLICENCTKELHIAYEFRLKCLNFNERLLQFTTRQDDSQRKYNICDNIVVKRENNIMGSENQIAGTEGSKKIFTCDPCDRNFTKKLSLEKHINTIHMNEKNVSKETHQYHCTKCSYSTPYSQTMLNHKRRHDGEKPYQCECGKAFTQRSTLNAHKKSHSDTTYYTCAICGKQFKLAHALTKHLSIHETGKYNCEICHKTLKSMQTLQHHMNRHYNIKNYNCDECGDKFVTHSELLYHKQKHSNEKKLTCHICKYKTNFKKCLTIHLKRHAGHKAFKCDFCNASFYTRSDEKRHQRVHTQKKCYSCPMCTQQFTRSPHVNKHMWTVHNLRFKWSELKKKNKKKTTTNISTCLVHH